MGTSVGMIRKISEKLDLPEPVKIIGIEQIATSEEIRRAMRIRREQGKHVIPAPTFEVKKTFSGYLVDPLRFFLRGKAESPARNLVIEKSVVKPTFSSLGKFYIADTVVASVAARVGSEAPGVARVLKVLVESRPNGVEISLDVGVKYGFNIPTVLEQAQRQIKEMVEYMTALNVLAINVAARRLHLE
ncbi:MAG: Asp23/Gls24 family envelope stress response protein [Firmicutes bacterium]|nr:Asp23/Gls24 family envelope stress response protein [Bacillota bacterium]